MSSHNHLGFTLMELMIAIAILSVIAVLAAPSFQETFRRMESHQTQQIYRSAINFAKSRAVTQQNYIVICSSSDLKTCQNNQWNQGFIIFADTNKNRILDNRESIIRTEELRLKHGNVSWSSFGSRHLITFSERNGLPTDSNGSLIYCSKHSMHHFKLVLSKMGHSRIEAATTC